jgi:NADH dehydrogenase [ubiquinone] 1 alpha subcomplex assembly factor 1
MKNILFICWIFAMHLIMEQKEPLVFDFGENKNFGRWSIINDGVMGGLSESKAQLSGDAVLFSGNVSLKNNGGFVSLRGPMGNYDLSKYTTCEIRFKSDGKRSFEVLLERDTPFYLPKFRTTFVSAGSDWETISIPLKNFEVSRMGSTIQQGIDLANLQQIQRIGFILADKKEGSFQLWVDYLKFY